MTHKNQMECINTEQVRYRLLQASSCMLVVALHSQVGVLYSLLCFRRTTTQKLSEFFHMGLWKIIEMNEVYMGWNLG